MTGWMQQPIVRVGFVALSFLLFLSLDSAMFVVDQAEQAIIVEFGQPKGGVITRAGLHWKKPFVQEVRRFDKRLLKWDGDPNQIPTLGREFISVDTTARWRIVDPLSSLINVADFAGALQGVATTTLRAVAGDMLLDDVLSKRDQVNDVLRVKLGEQTERWGGKVTTVEIRELVPPPDVQASMNRVLTAERTRRAVINESEGARQSKINVAEGEKQSAILTAEGRRQAAILEAEGYSQALTRIFEAARNIDDRTMTLQYFEALKELGQGESTKYIIPLELTDLARRLGNFIDSGLDSGAAMHVSVEGKHAADEEDGRSA